MDERMRRFERLAAQGDEAARAQLIAARVRIGEFDVQRVKAAAHLRDPLAVQLDPGALPKVRCTCGGLAVCSRCKGTGAFSLPTNLVPFIRQSEIDTKILLAWACDCAEHVIPYAQEGNTFEELRAIIERARQRSSDLTAANTGAPCMVHRGIQLLVNASIMVRSLQPPARIRQALAGVVTCAYLAAKTTRVERNWQIAALTRRLLE